MRMGISQRIESLLALESTTEAQVDTLISACERLCDPSEMGERYKVLAVVSQRTPNRAADEPPAGFVDDERTVIQAPDDTTEGLTIFPTHPAVELPDRAAPP